MILRRSRNSIRGSTLLECVVALGVLGTALTLGTQALGWSAAQRRAGEQRQVALQEAANCLDVVRQLQWSELTPERLSQIAISDESQQRLPSAQLRVIPEATDDASTVKLRVEVQWLGRTGNTPLRVALVTWRYNMEAGR